MSKDSFEELKDIIYSNEEEKEKEDLSLIKKKEDKKEKLKEENKEPKKEEKKEKKKNKPKEKSNTNSEEEVINETQRILKETKSLMKTIEELKKEHKNIWKIECGTEFFISKALKRNEYAEIMDKVESDTVEDFEDIVEKTSDLILEACIVYPDDWRERVSYGNMKETVSDKIIEISGFFAKSEKL